MPNGFFDRNPCLDLPAGPWTRVDMALAVDDEISPYYDPMIGKLITWGRDRSEATSRMLRALREMRIVGDATNAGLLDRLLSSEAFRDAAFDTRFLEPFTRASAGALPDRASLERLAIACAVRAAERERSGAIAGSPSADGGGAGGNAWARAGRIMQLGGGLA